MFQIRHCAVRTIIRDRKQKLFQNKSRKRNLLAKNIVIKLNCANISAKMQIKLLLFLIFVIFTPCYGIPEKINISLVKSLQTKTTVDILVSFTEGTEHVIKRIGQQFFESRAERLTALYLALVSNAYNSQERTLQIVAEKYPDAKPVSFWISNQIYIQGAGLQMVNTLASLPAVSSIIEEPIVYLDFELNSVENSSERNDTIIPNAEWGIDKIQAQQAWSTPGGNNGAGVIVGTIDTGVRRSHEALINNYVGDYGWFDAYNRATNPFDDHGHGTHVTGTVAGSLGYGVAPGSRWAACKALRSDNSGTGAALLACGQFFACPTNPAGNNPDCSKAPHIVSNSWMADGNGGGVTWFNSVIIAWHAAGITPVFANGNSGTNCYTGMSPADGNVIAVGSTTSTDALSTFSGVGPSYYNELKPDVSAPGTNVRSAYHTSDTAWATMSGTSMATPHVAGVIALMKSRDRAITYTRAKTILQATCDVSSLISAGRTCNGIRDSVFPNYHFGHGRVNALQALITVIGSQ